MDLEQLNAELSRLASIPEDKRTQSDLDAIHAIEQSIDAMTSRMYGDL